MAPFLKTCPNEARPAAERWHGNIQYCQYCQSTNDDYDAEAANLLAQSSNTSRLVPNNSGIPSASAPPSIPGVPQIPGPSQYAHPVASLPGMPSAPVPPTTIASQLPGAVPAPIQAPAAPSYLQYPPASTVPQLLPSPFPFAGSSVARPSNSTYAAAQAQRAANARVTQAASQAIAPHAGNRLPGALQGLLNQNAAGSNLTETQTVSLQLVLLSWKFLSARDQRVQKRTFREREEVGSGSRFEINNRVFSTLSDVISQQLAPHFSLRMDGNTRYEQFIERVDELIFYTGSSTQKAQELTVLPGSLQTVFDLQRYGIHRGPRGMWMVYVVLQIDETSYEDLRLDIAREELEKAQKKQQLEEIELQTEEARRAQERAARERKCRAVRADRNLIHQWDIESDSSVLPDLWEGRDGAGGAAQADSDSDDSNFEPSDDDTGSATKANTLAPSSPPLSTPCPETDGPMTDLLERVSITPQRSARPSPAMGITQDTPAAASTPIVSPGESSTINVELPSSIDLTSPERVHRRRSDKLRMNLRQR